jgi:hypothetical protein
MQMRLKDGVAAGNSERGHSVHPSHFVFMCLDGLQLEHTGALLNMQ